MNSIRRLNLLFFCTISFVSHLQASDRELAQDFPPLSYSKILLEAKASFKKSEDPGILYNECDNAKPIAQGSFQSKVTKCCAKDLLLGCVAKKVVPFKRLQDVKMPTGIKGRPRKESVTNFRKEQCQEEIDHMMVVSLAAKKRAEAHLLPEVKVANFIGTDKSYTDYCIIYMDLITPPPADPATPSSPPLAQEDVAIKQLTELVSGLAMIHALGIVHRDIRAPNILECSTGNSIIIDFGLAKLIGNGRKILEEGLTSNHLPPEMVKKRDNYYKLYSLQRLFADKPLNDSGMYIYGLGVAFLDTLGKVDDLYKSDKRSFSDKIIKSKSGNKNQERANYLKVTDIRQRVIDQWSKEASKPSTETPTDSPRMKELKQLILDMIGHNASEKSIPLEQVYQRIMKLNQNEKPNG